MLCQWYAMFAYWQYITFAVGRSLYDTSDPSTAAFREATLTTQQAGALYNFIAFLGALLLIPIVAKLGARLVHAFCLTASGIAMLLIPGVETPAALFVLMIGIGIGWAGMMGNTYVMLADSIPADTERHLYGHLQHVHRAAHAVPDADHAADLRSRSGRRSAQCLAIGWRLDDRRRICDNVCRCRAPGSA